MSDSRFYGEESKEVVYKRLLWVSRTPESSLDIFTSTDERPDIASLAKWLTGWLSQYLTERAVMAMTAASSSSSSPNEERLSKVDAALCLLISKASQRFCRIWTMDQSTGNVFSVRMNSEVLNAISGRFALVICKLFPMRAWDMLLPLVSQQGGTNPVLPLHAVTDMLSIAENVKELQHFVATTIFSFFSAVISCKCPTDLHLKSFEACFVYLSSRQASGSSNSSANRKALQTVMDQAISVVGHAEPRLRTIRAELVGWEGEIWTRIDRMYQSESQPSAPPSGTLGSAIPAPAILKPLNKDIQLDEPVARDWYVNRVFDEYGYLYDSESEESDSLDNLPVNNNRLRVTGSGSEEGESEEGESEEGEQGESFGSELPLSHPRELLPESKPAAGSRGGRFGKKTFQTKGQPTKERTGSILNQGDRQPGRKGPRENPEIKHFAGSRDQSSSKLGERQAHDKTGGKQQQQKQEHEQREQQGAKPSKVDEFKGSRPAQRTEPMTKTSTPAGSARGGEKKDILYKKK